MKLSVKVSFLLLALLANVTRLPASRVAEQQYQQHTKRGIGEGKQWLSDEEEDSKQNPQLGSPKSSAQSKLYFKPISQAEGKKKFIKVKNMRCYFEDDGSELKSSFYSPKKQVEKSVAPEKKKHFSIGSGFDISTDLHTIDGKVAADVGMMLPHAVAGTLFKDAMGQLVEGTKQMFSNFVPPKEAEYSTSQRSNSVSDATGVYKSILDIIGMLSKVTDNIGLLLDDRFRSFIKFLQEMLDKITHFSFY